MRKALACFLAILTLLSPALSIPAAAAQESAYTEAVFSEETTEAATAAAEETTEETEAAPPETTAEETTASTQETQAGTKETQPTGTARPGRPEPTVPSKGTEPVNPSVPQETTVSGDATVPAETRLPSLPEEKPEPPKSVWDQILGFLGLLEEDGPLQLLKLNDAATGQQLSLEPEFSPACYSYTAQVPELERYALEIQSAQGFQVSVNGSPAEGRYAVLQPQWDAEGKYPVIIRLVSGADVFEYSLTLIRQSVVPTGLKITRMPQKTAYVMGESFDPTGLEAEVTLSDNTTLVPQLDELVFSPDGPLSKGTAFVTAAYKNVSVRVDIAVTGQLSGSGTKEDPYLLKTQEDLFTLDDWFTLDIVRSGFFRMENDIVITGFWDGIGALNHPFTGDFDGGGHQVTIPAGGKALFAQTRKADVHDLKVYGSQIADYGLISNYVVDTTAEYCVHFYRVTLVGGTQTLYSGFIGGYASSMDPVLVEDCTVESGVIIGYDKQQSHIGSFGGEFNGTVRNSTSAATVYGKDWVGGLVGNKGQSMSDLIVDGSSFTGTVSATGKYVGGIAGGGYAGTRWGMPSAPNATGVEITGCTSSGSISGGSGVGGILGAEACVQQFWSNGVGKIQNNRFTGTVKASGKYVGGVIGFLQSMNKHLIISGNYYKNASAGIGGVGHVDTDAVTNGFHNGTYYYNTSLYIPDAKGGVKEYIEKINTVSLEQYIDLPTIGSAESGQYRALSVPSLNRTDDPLGADYTKLCYTDGTMPNLVRELKKSGSCKTEYTQGDALDLTGLTLTAIWYSGSETAVDIKDVTVTDYKPNSPGKQTVLLHYQGTELRLTVTVTPKPVPATVSVTILGDSNHGPGGTAHGLAMGGLTTWASNGSLSVKTSQTVWDALKAVMDAKGLSYTASADNKYETMYISAVNGLAEFDNGKNSGWMYTVNGTHPNVGVDAKYLKAGDKIVLHYTDDYTYEEGGPNYKKPEATAKSAAQKVIDLINRIGTVTDSAQCSQRIQAARTAFDALTPAEKLAVTNRDALTAAEKKYQELKQASDKTKAEKVIALIDKIGTPVNKKSKQKIEAARRAYNALTEDQKKLVTNAQILSVAETTYAKLTATKKDLEKAQAVMESIQLLSDPARYTQEAVSAARKAYDALTSLQKLLVENYAQLEAAEAVLADRQSSQLLNQAYQATADYMKSLGTPGVGSIGGEWCVIGLARSGQTVPGVEEYYRQALEYIQKNVDPATMRLHKVKSTDNSRMILALTAIGKDVTDVGGCNLLEGLSDLEYVKYQGNNGPIWALLALDSGNYPVPVGGTVTRSALIEELLSVQTSDGGWAIAGDQADSDMTGMALQALAPYYKTDTRVHDAIDKAIDRLSRMQNADGSFSASYGDGNALPTSESIAQVVTALAALGIDPNTDPRFVKENGSALEALLRFYVDGGGFRHVMDGKRDGMATEQAYYALTAYFRSLKGEKSLYDMTDVIDLGGDTVPAPAQIPLPREADAPKAEPPQKRVSPLLIPAIALLVLGAAALIVLLLLRRKGSGKENAQNSQKR